MSKFKPGTSGNPKGRRRGTPNKSTEELRELLKNFFELNFETLQSDFDQLEPKDRLNFLLNLLKHVLPAPVHELERLTDSQLDEIISRLKQQQQQNLRIS